MRRNRTWAVVGAAFAALLALTPAPGTAQVPTPEEARLALESGVVDGDGGEWAATPLDELLEAFGVPGVSVAVIHDFEIHWSRAYGVADVETGAPVDVETLFQAASISKPVAAMASLVAVREGLFGLDDDINEVLRSWSLPGEGMTDRTPVTPRSLMSHTSGLGDAFGFPGYDPGAPLPSLVEIFEGAERSNVGRIFMEREPWTAFEYSGGGVTLQQQALMDARGLPFDEIARRDVLEPIGMARSTFTQPLPPEWDANAARAHDDEGRSMGAKWHVYPEQAAAGLWTTPTDLAQFAIEVQRAVRGDSERVLSRALAREMITPVGVGDYGVGFGLSKEGEGWYFQHGGGNWGFRCFLIAHTRKGYGYAIMTNGDQGIAVANELGRRLQQVYRWDSVQAPVPRGYAPPIERAAVDLPVDALERVLGTYRLAEGPVPELTFELEEGQLVVAVPGQGRFPVFAESDSAFFLRVAPVRFRFTTGGDGTVDGLFLLQAGREVRAERVVNR
ncbi:MAG: serine hydrolase [Gemmatimonadetes bacterium]|nr:serine hydrolase [Gemmatimonadota bacterium]